MRTLYKHITECHTQTNNRDTNQREHYITYYRMRFTNK